MSETGQDNPQSQKPKASGALKAALGVAGVGLIAFFYVVFSGLSKPADAGGYARYATGALKKLEVKLDPPPASQKEFQTVDGFPVTLRSFRGQVVVLNLWATWCAPCVEEMPTLGALQRAYEGRPVQVVAVNVDPAKLRPQAVAQLERLTDGALKFYADPTLAVAFDSGASQGMPVTVVYAKDGREIARMTGAADWASAEARALIDAALAE